MSLETAIERNTEALNTLIGILTKGVAPLEAPVQPALSAPETKPVEAKKKAAPVSSEPTYEEASSAVTAVIKAKGTPAAKDILADFGVTNLKQLDKSRYAEIIEAAWKVALS
jgi:hypothetical protein